MDKQIEAKILRFARTISGHYSNYSQSKENSKCFAHINIFFKPLPWSILKCPSFYSEQSYDYNIWSPYRQAILKVLIKENNLILENFKLENAQRIAGAGIKSELLIEIEKDKLIFREGCCMNFKELKSGYYLGEIEPGRDCIVKRNNKFSYLVSKVAIYNDKWISEDSGFEINTNKKLWGSDFGPFLFKKINSQSKEINKKWLYG